LRIGKFYTAAGYYQFFSKGNTYTALELLEKGLTLSRSCGEIDTQCLILTTIADIRWGMGEYATAQARANEARRLANLTVNLYQEALALCTLAQCAGQLGNYRNSIIHFHRAKEIQAICGMLGGRTDIHIEGGRAEIHLLKSEYMDARSIFTQILQDSDQDLLVSAHALVDIARIDVIIGAAEQHVQKNLNEATRIFSTLDHFRGGVLCNMVLADLKLRERDIISAKPLFENVLHLTRGRQNEVISFALERLADRSRWKLKEYTATWPTVYLGHAQQSKRKLDLHKALFFLGDVFISQGDDDTGYSLFTVALEGFVCMDVHHSRAQCLFRLGDLANKKGDFSQAVELWTAARPFFERSSQAKDTAKIDGRLAELENKQMALVHLAKLHFPETVFEELSSEVEKFCD
jgi:tetratricopeptide (TPR) repeat protein